MIIIFIFIALLYSDVFPGYTLFSPLSNQGEMHTTYLIDNDGNEINTWTHDCKPKSISYLLPDSTILVPCSQSEVDGLGAGNQLSGGRIIMLSWEGETLWDDIFIKNSYLPEEDLNLLPIF